jgi:hydrogenase-4 component B
LSGAAALLAAGLAVLGAGGAIAIRRPWLGPAMLLQAAGLTAIGVGGAWVMVADQAAGASFSNGTHVRFGIDPLSGFFLAALALSAAPALVFARGSLAGSHSAPALAALTAAFVAALVGVLTARDVTSFLACWELMTLVPAAAMLTYRREAEVRRSAYVYVAFTHAGGVGVWLSLLVLANAGAIGDGNALAAKGSGTQALVLLAALIGFGTKAGLMPLHGWLPRAHPVAPAHISAVMSGMMIKVALYGLIRVLFEWSGAPPLWLGLVVLAVGMLSAIGGVLYALMQHELKRLLAFHSIENVGIIMLGLGAALLFRHAGDPVWTGIAFAAALLHTLNHAVFKSLLFLGAGSFERAAHGLDLDQMGGLLRRMPWTGGAFLIGSMAIAGLPPLNGFASEWLTLQALLHLSQESGTVTVVAGALAMAGLAATAALAVYCFVKVTGLVLLGQPRRRACEEAVEVSADMRWPVVFLAAACVALGVLPALLVPTLAGISGAPHSSAGLSLTPPLSGSLPGPALLIVLVALTAVLVALRGKSAAPEPAWVCGQQDGPALRWTSAGFTKPLRIALDAVLRPTREVTVDRSGGVVQRVEHRTHVPHHFDTALYAPVVAIGLRLAAHARRLQSGSLQTYMMYLLGLVFGLLVLARLGVL